MSSLTDDEFFGNQDSDNDFNGLNQNEEEQALQKCSMAERETRATEEQFRNMGYLKAYEDSKEERLQEGFEAGYKQYFDAAMKLGELLGEATSPLQDDDVSKEKRENVNQVVRSIRSFLTDVQTDDSDSIVSLDTLNTLAGQLDELVLSNTP